MSTGVAENSHLPERESSGAAAALSPAQQLASTTALKELIAGTPNNSQRATRSSLQSAARRNGETTADGADRESDLSQTSLAADCGDRAEDESPPAPVRERF